MKTQEFIENLQKNWVIVLLVAAGTIVTGTWAVCNVLFILPRDTQISYLQDQLKDAQSKAASCIQTVAPVTPTPARDPIVLQETGVFAGSAVTTVDGVCQVAIASAQGNDIELTVTLGTERPQLFRYVHPGDRVSASGKSGTYLVDIHRIRGDIVDLMVTKSPR